MNNLNDNRIFLRELEFDRRDVLQLDSTRHSGLNSISEQELTSLDFSFCPNCRTPIGQPKWEEVDGFGGNSFDYRIHNCEWCGWWTIFKIWIDSIAARARDEYIIESIQHVGAACTHHGSLSDFNHYAEHPELQFLIRFLSQQNERLREISWTAFQDLAKAYLIDEGMDVADISRIRSSGGDFLCLDSNGNVIVVEVKHLNKRPVDIGAVWKVMGVVTSEGLDGGMIITSHRFSPDAITLMERGSVGRITQRDERRGMKHVSREDLVDWLHHVQERNKSQMQQGISDFIMVDSQDHSGV